MSLACTVLDVFADQQAVEMLSWVTLVFVILVVVAFTGFYALTYWRTDGRACRDRRPTKQCGCRRRRASSPRAGKSPGDDTLDGHASSCPSTSSVGARSVDENGPSDGAAAACRNKRPETRILVTTSAPAADRPRPDSGCDNNSNSTPYRVQR